VKNTAWRLVHPVYALGKASREHVFADGRFHYAGDQIIYAWETAELASLAVAELTGGITPRVMLREKLIFPDDAQLNVLTSRRFILRVGAQDTLRHMRQRNILSLWIPSELYASQRLVVIDPLHKAFDQILVGDSRFLVCRDQKLAQAES